MTDSGPAQTDPPRYGLGIDLGTVWIRAAVCGWAGRHPAVPTVVPLGSHGDAIPTLVAIGPDGTVEIGEAARAASSSDSWLVIRDIKRFVGDPAPLAPPNWTPERLIARLVDHVVARVCADQGLPPSHITLAVPTCWGDHNRRLITDAVAARDLAVTVVSGVGAAGEQYAATLPEHGRGPFAIYDFGGGFFDAAVLEPVAGEPGADESGAGEPGADESGAAVARVTLSGPPEGSDRIGGIDLDDLVVDHVCVSFPGTAPMAADLWERCARAKEALTTDSTTPIRFGQAPGADSVTLDRTMLESMMQPLVEQTVALLKRAIASAGTTPEALSEVLLLGGTSRIPMVAQKVAAALGRPVTAGPDTETLVARGAASVAARLAAAGTTVTGVPAATAVTGVPATTIRAFESPQATPHRAGVPWRGRLARTAAPRRTSTRLRPPATSRPSRSRGIRSVRRASGASVRWWSAFPIARLRPTGGWSLQSRPWSILLPAMLLGASLTAVAAVALAAVAGGTTSLASTPAGRAPVAGIVADVPTITPPVAAGGLTPGPLLPTRTAPTTTARAPRRSASPAAPAGGPPSRPTPTSAPAGASVVPTPAVPLPVAPTAVTATRAMSPSATHSTSRQVAPAHVP